MKKTYVIILSVILVMAIAACNPYGGIPVGPGGLPIIPGDNPSEDPGTDVSTEEGLKEALSDPTVKKINLTTDVPVPAEGLNISTDKEFAGTGALEFTAAPSNSPAIVIADGADVTGLNLIVGSGTDGASMLQSKSAGGPIHKFISVTGNGTVMSRVSITVNKIDNASYNAITVGPGVTGFQFKDGLRMLGYVFFTSSYSGTLVEETDETRPFWTEIASLDYSAMWEDDRLWLPMALEGKKFDGRFIFDDKTMIDAEVIEEEGNEDTDSES